jgi:hypothetical protein
VHGTRTGEAVDQPITLLEGQSQSLVLHFQARAAAPVAVVPAAPVAQPAPVATPIAPTAKGPESKAPEPHASGGGKKTLAYVALAAGGVGLAVGGITGGLAISKRSALDANPACKDGVCDSSIQNDIDSFRTMRTVSTVGFIVGGVCAGAGVVIWLASGSGSKDTREAARLGFRVAPNAVSMMGSF